MATSNHGLEALAQAQTQNPTEEYMDREIAAGTGDLAWLSFNILSLGNSTSKILETGRLTIGMGRWRGYSWLLESLGASETL